MTIKVDHYGVDLYKVKVNNGGTIEFDIGSGNFVVNGNLTVQGATTTIESQDLNVIDRVITLNSGDPGPGVSQGTSGIWINRGSSPDARILFNEAKSFLNPETGQLQNGVFVFDNELSDLVGIYTNSIKTNGESLYLLSSGTGVLNVTGTVDYEKQVFPYTGNDITTSILTSNRLSNPFDDDIIPNIRSVIDYVRDYHLYNYQNKISTPAPEGNTEISVFDVLAGDPVSKASVKINNTTVIEIFETNTTIGNFNFQNNTLSNTNADDLILSANNISVTGSFEIPKLTGITAPSDGIKLFAGTQDEGGTGLYFINENGTTDEFISKDKALLYSILF